MNELRGVENNCLHLQISPIDLWWYVVHILLIKPMMNTSKKGYFRRKIIRKFTNFDQLTSFRRLQYQLFGDAKSNRLCSKSEVFERILWYILKWDSGKPYKIWANLYKINFLSWTNLLIKKLEIYNKSRLSFLITDASFG